MESVSDLPVNCIFLAASALFAIWAIPRAPSPAWAQSFIFASVASPPMASRMAALWLALSRMAALSSGVPAREYSAPRCAI